MEKRIYYHDTDSGGVVYYANYLKYLEEARTEFLEGKSLSVTLLRERGMIYAVRKCQLTYKSPARYGDTILCRAWLKKITAAQLIFDQEVRDKPSGRLLVIAEITLVSLNRDFQPIPIPEDVRACLQ
jgi:acyl-CoA thioester hydrolase